ncbi:hypothetical protein KIPB_011148, partial [Kipferlia bialata]
VNRVQRLAVFGAALAHQERERDQRLATTINEYPELLIVDNDLLYCDCKIEGHPMQAFVDTGAQSSVINISVARKAGVAHLIDTRFQGTLAGVGTSKVLGRLVVTLEMGGMWLPCMFIVSDAPILEILIGIDMVRRHRMIIDLSGQPGCLRMSNGTTVPFLQGSQIKRHVRPPGQAPAPTQSQFPH